MIVIGGFALPMFLRAIWLAMRANRNLCTSRTGALTAVKRQIKALADPRDRQEDGMFHQGFSAEIYKPEGSAVLRPGW
jgi:hypothetical protein